MKGAAFKDRKSIVDKLLETSAKSIVVPSVEQPIVLDNQYTTEDGVQAQPAVASTVDEQGGLPVVGGVATAVLQSTVPKPMKKRRGKDKVATRKPRKCKLCVKAGNIVVAACCPGRAPTGNCLYYNDDGTTITTGII